MAPDLSICSPNAAAALLYPTVSDIVAKIIIPAATVRDPQRTGGWFAFWRSDPLSAVAVPVLGFAVGMVSPERFRKYMHFANEKAARLGARPMDISSWQSRDEGDPDRMKHCYGGAIRCGQGLFFSFSGFSEHEDEMICAIAAYHHALLTDAQLQQTMSVSNNRPLRDYLVVKYGF